jgi:hypothetical protein
MIREGNSEDYRRNAGTRVVFEFPTLVFLGPEVRAWRYESV